SQANLFRWVFDSFEPIIYRGAALDLVRGRESGRANSSPQATGHSIMDAILQIAQFAPPADAARMKSLVKEWALTDTVRDFVGARPLPTLTLAKQLMNDGTVSPRGELIAHFTFPEMDREVHHAAGYEFGLSMCSTRIANFESINGDNMRGWFTGDGMTSLYTSDLGQYTDAYWATIDQYRLPGVTADVTHNKLPAVAHSIGPRAQGQSTTSPHNWVGGATLGRFGAAGMQFKGVGVTLTGKKSWFMFDDEIVCLGAGITSTDNRPIETIVDNRKIAADGANAFTVNGVAKSPTLGWTESLGGVQWAHLAGPVVGSDIGYYFPQPASITAVREARTGAWSDIDDGGTSTPITRNFLRMSFVHGNSPTNAAYQYVILPGRNVRRMVHYVEAPQIYVIANNANVQAVEETTLGITAVNFWTDSSQTAGTITADKKCSVLVQQEGPFVDVSVSDPTQVNTGSIALQIAIDGGTLVTADSGVTVTQSSPTIALSVNVNGASGRTLKARFYLGTPDTFSVAPVADAYVHDAAASVDTNFGTASTLIVKKSGVGYNRESFLRFDVPASTGTFLGAALKLTCLSVSTPGEHGLMQVPDTSWGETAITWNNKPATSGSLLSTWTPVLNETASHDVTPAITGSGLVSFKLYGTTQTTDGFVTYASRQHATAGSRPELVLTLGHAPPVVVIASPADGEMLAQAGSTTITADVQATDGAITSVAFYDGVILLGTDTSAPYSFVATLGGGPHSLTAIASDANGLSRTSLVSRIDVPFPPVAIAGSAMTPLGAPIDVDLRSLVSDVETPLTALRFELGAASNGAAVLLADAHTVRFTPAANYSGPASFAYTVVDTTRDARTVFNYDFKDSNLGDASGQGRDGTLNVQGTGAGSFVADIPAALMPFQTQSLFLTENGTAGAARMERSLANDVIDFKNADWTIAGWFKRSAALNQDTIVHLGESGGYGSNAMTLAFYNTSSTINLRNYNGATLDCDISTTAAVGQWHHFVIVRSGGTLSWYLNGNVVGSDSSFTFSFDSGKPIKFGGVTTSVLDRWLNGSLADLAMFSSTLSPLEISKLTTTPVASFGGQSATSSVAISVLAPIESWRQDRFGTISGAGLFADLADKDYDGVANLLEYAMGMNPNVHDAVPISSQKNGGTLEFVFTRNKSAADLSYGVEWTETLNNLDWSTIGVSLVLVPGSDNGTTQQWKATLPAGTTRRFVRLRVTR
ncbi:MAG: DNRLRE domain-containing protein, partial [Verrucomicrobiales bacterium]|nr:DNRLRE domain-containing protein [Verrucomicrobiales bacterium]